MMLLQRIERAIYSILAGQSFHGGRSSGITWGSLLSQLVQVFEPILLVMLLPASYVVQPFPGRFITF